MQKAQFGPFGEVEDEEEGLCEEEEKEDRALKPLVPARVAACDTTGGTDFWANSVPEYIVPLITTDTPILAAPLVEILRDKSCLFSCPLLGLKFMGLK